MAGVLLLALALLYVCGLKTPVLIGVAVLILVASIPLFNKPTQQVLHTYGVFICMGVFLQHISMCKMYGTVYCIIPTCLVQHLLICRINLQERKTDDLAWTS